MTADSRGGEARPGRDLQKPTSADAEPALVPGRSCGTCSLCCKVYPVPELAKPAAQWCVHCAPGSGCAVHADRPYWCRAFFCAWRLDPHLGPEWKPEACRFVLAAEPAHQAMAVMVDPGMPLAWKREPYYSRLKQFSELAFRQDRKVLVNLRGNITVVLPDREVPIGPVGPGDEIVVWRDGAAYGATLRRGPQSTSEKAYAAAAAGIESPPGAASPKAAASAPSPDDPGFLDSVVREAFEKTAKLLGDADGDLAALTSTILRGRNKVLDEAAESYSRAAGAACQPGCTSCCYLMVQGTPYEILSIARHLLESKTPAEIEGIKERLHAAAQVPLDPLLRLKAKMPCALLENGRCSIYQHRPSVCRMTLSQSRAACDSCLQTGSGSIPYIDRPGQIAAAMQMGIDHALGTRRKLATEEAELSRALLIALRDPEATLATWLEGKDPFPGTHVGVPSNERAAAAARRLGLE